MLECPYLYLAIPIVYEATKRISITYVEHALQGGQALNLPSSMSKPKV